jgi:peptidylprolyl isomerase
MAHGFGAAALVAVLAGCGGSGGSPGAPVPAGEPEDVAFAPELAIDLAAMELTRAGLYMQDIRPGDGLAARRTSLVTLHYVGYLPDGRIFDTSAGGEPFQFRLGAGEVIRGWDQGVRGMRLGGLRRLVIRPGLAYGSRGTGSVPANTTLVFDVHLLAVR